MEFNLPQLIDRIRDSYYAFPPASDSDIAEAVDRGVPDCLLNLYRLADGALLGTGDDFPDPAGNRYRLLIPRLADLRTTQECGYVFDDAPYYTKTANWWQIVDYCDGSWLALDATREGDGRILDVFQETAGYEDEHNVVALDLIELLFRLLEKGGVYWFDEDFRAHSRM